jgi:hypothetical protein
MAMKDVKSAADFRRVIEKIARKVIDKERPPVRQGRVYSFNAQTNVAMVLFPGNTIEGLVPVTFGKNMIPSVAMEDTFATDGYDAAGDVVRVAGKPNDWYVIGFSVGLPVSEHTQQTSIVGAYEDQTTLTGSGNATLTLTYTPVEHSEHLYWNGIYQDKDQWTRDARVVSVPDPDLLFRPTDELAMEYLYTDGGSTPTPVVGASLLYVGATIFAHTTSVALPAGTQVGDVMVVSMHTGASFGVHTATCSDPRITSQQRGDYDLGGSWPELNLIGWGYATTLDNLAVVLDSLEGNDFGELFVYRTTGSIAETYSHGNLDHTATVNCNPTIGGGAVSILSLAWAADAAGGSAAGWSRDAYNTGTISFHASGHPAAHILSGTGTEVVEWLALHLGVSDA